MVLGRSGNVGIGTATPAAKLDIVAAGNDVVSLSGGATATLLNFNAVSSDDFAIGTITSLGGLGVKNLTDDRYDLFFAGNGNVGIGTTSPQAKLHVAGGNLLVDEFLLGRDGSAGLQQLIRSRGMGYDQAGYPGVQIGQPGSHIALFIDPSTVTGGSFGGNEPEIMLPNSTKFQQANGGGTDWINTMTLLNGNVGIGTTTPSRRLSLYESLANGGAEAALIVQDYSNTDSGADYIKALEIDKIKYNIPADATAFGYQIGFSPQVYVFDENFRGTIDNQWAIWARTGMHTIGDSGPRTINNAYGIYIEGLTTSGGTIHNHFGIYQEGAGTKNYFGGNVGIGTTAPGALLHLVTNDPDDSGGIRLERTAGTAGRYNFEIVSTGDFQLTETAVASRLTVQKTTGNVGIGTTSPQAKLHVVGETRTSVLEITGGADLAEPFEMTGGNIPKGAVVVIDEENPGRLKMSDCAYDKRVAGIVSGANGVNAGITLSQQGLLEGGQNVALSGRVYVLADATNGAIKPGDMLTTSTEPGHAMKAGDPSRSYGSVLGKAMTGLKEGRGLVLVLVSLQ